MKIFTVSVCACDAKPQVVLLTASFSTGPSFLMADPMGPLLDQDEEEALSPSSSLEGKAPASPPLSFSSYASSSSPYQTLSSSPPPSPDLLLGSKAESDSFPWLGATSLLQGGSKGKTNEMVT